MGSGAVESTLGPQPPSVSVDLEQLVGQRNKNITAQPVSQRTAKSTQKLKEWSAMSASLHKWMANKGGVGVTASTN